MFSSKILIFLLFFNHTVLQSKFQEAMDKYELKTSLHIHMSWDWYHEVWDEDEEEEEMFSVQVQAYGRRGQHSTTLV